MTAHEWLTAITFAALVLVLALKIAIYHRVIGSLNLIRELLILSKAHNRIASGEAKDAREVMQQITTESGRLKTIPPKDPEGIL